MKSVASNDKCEKNIITYPCLMINSKQDTSKMSWYHSVVVLFVANGAGTVVHDFTDPSPRTGKLSLHSNRWTMSRFTDYTGSVCLTNED